MKNHIKEQSIIQASLNCQFEDSRLLYTEYLKTKKGKSLRENSGILPVIGRASADTLVIGQIGLITMETHRFSRHLVDFGRILAYLTETKRFFENLKRCFLKLLHLLPS